MAPLDFLRPQSAQAPGAMSQPSGFGRLLAPEVALPMAAALLGNQGNTANFGNALGAAGQGLQAQKANQAELAQQNRTLDFFKANAPEYAQMVEAGMPVGDAWKQYTQQRFAQQSDPYKVVGGQIFDTRDKSFTSPPPLDGPPETGLTPVMFRNPKTGEIIYGQPTKDGRILKSDVPEGFEPVSPYDKSFQTSLGKAQGENAASLGAKTYGIEESVRLVDEIVAHPSLSTAVGPIQGRLPSFTAGSRDFDQRVEQLKGRAFLQARQELKGGGQITDFEGARAEAALVRASQAVDEDAFKQAMAEFRDALVKGFELLAQGAGAGAGASRAGGADYKTKYGLD